MEVNSVLIKSFEKWMLTLGYAETTVYNSGIYVTDFFEWLKQQHIKELNQITKSTIKAYYKYLQIRKNKRQTGSLSQNYIGLNVFALKNLSQYLTKTQKAFLEIDIQCFRAESLPKNILTQSEIKTLYQACTNDYLGIRDKAILHIYYGCGLRRSEGTALRLQDILLKEKLIHVRKGKGYKERYVPITELMKDDLENYIYVSRSKLLSQNNTNKERLQSETEASFFINTKSQPMSGGGINLRVQELTKETRINKDISLHILRHSIATHLLQSGMSLEEVSSFLGHSSLGSTQIYTHITNVEHE